jgi:hypothetical protein
MAVSARKRIWGWYFFDWASQPYNTLLLTFIFGPYINELLGDGTAAQTAWGFGDRRGGLIIALLAPCSARWRIRRAAGCAGSGASRSSMSSEARAVVRRARRLQPRPDPRLFRLGLIGMEFATTFTHAMLPTLGPARISGGCPATAGPSAIWAGLWRLSSCWPSSPKARPRGAPFWASRPPSGWTRKRARARASWGR